VFDLLLSALDDTDSALVVATHDESVAQRMEKLWHMCHGHLEADG
jgi:putative ABC transport system ATP-binding protein/lipoprotein-releasing system ATP-binding protein